MASPFIPLTLAAPAGPPASGGVFQRLTVPPPPPMSPVAATALCSQHAATAPVVSLRRDGEQVTHIRIQCPCGQLIELECVF